VREPWLNLNGWWAFGFDPDDVGEGDGWHRRRPDEFPDRIRVPFPWESLLAWGDEARASDQEYYSRRVYPAPDEVQHVDAIVFRSGAGAADYRVAPRQTIGWYGRHLEVPASWRGRRIFVTVGASDFHTKAWVNGEFVGEHTGGYTPCDFEITSALRGDGPQVLVIRVYDAQRHDRQPGGKQHHWYQRTSGIWQTVYLEARGAAYIRAVHVTPDVPGAQAHVRVGLSDADRAPGASLRVTVVSPDNRMASVATPANAGGAAAAIPLDSPVLWDLDAPFLYRVIAELVHPDGALEDRVETYFGMRAITVEPLPGTPHRYVHLNGRPVYLRGVLDQGFHPAGVYSYPSDAAIREDIRTAKQCGFNMIRMHIKIQDPRYLYWADREGVLLMADIPNFGYDGYAAEAQRWWEHTLREAIARDFNHPSVFAWSLFNESWGVGGDQYRDLPDRQAWVRGMYRLAKQLDPTRLIEDMSPNRYDHVETDVNSWHFYIKEYGEVRAHVRRVVDSTYPSSPFNFVPGCVQGTEPLMNSEYGGISAHDGDIDTSWHLRMLTNELRLHENICGYIYTQLTDVEWEHNGVVRYDRTGKEFGYPLTGIHAPDFVALDAPPLLNGSPGDDIAIPVRVSLFSPRAPRDLVLRWRLDVIDTGGRRHADVVSGARPIRALSARVHDPGALALALPRYPHLGTLHVWLEGGDGGTVARNFLFIDVSGEARVAETGTPLLPGGSRWQPPARTLRLVADVGTPVAADWEQWERLAEGAAVVGLGRGSFTYELRREPSATAGAVGSSALAPVSGADLVFEASAGSLAPAQTDTHQVPTTVRVRVDGETERADARGCLSWAAGLRGQYGYLIRVPLHSDLLPRLTSAIEATAPVPVSFTVESRDASGLTLFGPRAGRYPVPLAILASW
jgi:hypothetical protein